MGWFDSLITTPAAEPTKTAGFADYITYGPWTALPDYVPNYDNGPTQLPAGLAGILEGRDPYGTGQTSWGYLPEIRTQVSMPTIANVSDLPIGPNGGLGGPSVFQPYNAPHIDWASVDPAQYATYSVMQAPEMGQGWRQAAYYDPQSGQWFRKFGAPEMGDTFLDKIAPIIALGGVGAITGAGLLGLGGAGAAATGAGATGAAAGAVPLWAPSLAGTAFSVGAIGPAELAMLTSAGFTASEIAALGAGVAGLGALPGAGLATGTASSAPAGSAAGVGGDIFGPPSWLANSGSNWLANMGPVASQAGATFNANLPWYAQLAEAQTLGGSGLTAAEMGTLGVSPWAAQIGAQTWLPSITGPSSGGSSALSNLSKLPVNALSGQLGGTPAIGTGSGGDGQPEFTPTPSTMSPMWGGVPNYQQFEHVSFAGTAPTLLERLGRIRNG